MGRMRVLELVVAEGPSGLRPSTRDRPEVSSQGVVVRVSAVGINFPDLLACRGMYQYKPPLPYVPGCEVAGVVEEVGPDSKFAVGDRVAMFVWEGGFAEWVSAPDRNVMILPDSASMETGAGLIVNYHTVFFGLDVRGRLQKGESVLVLGAGGGIGSAALQVGRAMGARVVAGVTDETQERTARAAGADEVMFLEDGFSSEMQRLTAGRGFDMVLDPLGDRFFDEAIRGMAPGGRVLVVGFAAGQVPKIAVNRLLLRNISVVGVAWGAYLDVDPRIVASAGARLSEMLEVDAIAPHIADRFQFGQIPVALEKLGRGEIRGKAVAILG